MSLAISRTDTSVIGQWWWTVDRKTVAAILVLVALGLILVTAASPPVAQRIGLPAFHFVIRHLVIVPVTMAAMIGVSLLSPLGVRRLALAMLGAGLIGLVLTLVAGSEIKGAQRWIRIAGLSLQPSEFIKPAFVVMTGWLIARARMEAGFPGRVIATALFAVIALMLIRQPDLGMTVVIGAVFAGQLFIAGVPIAVAVGLGLLGAAGLGFAYLSLPHVESRINRFLFPESGDTYQIDRSLEALAHGGWTGTGPGHGTVKYALPDAHADFVFAVAGEEFGILTALILVALFAFIVLRGFTRAMNDPDLFVVLAAGGLFMQFGVQALVHMGSTLALLPAKGMTLPFVSYGGSSALALGIAMGMALALTRRRFGSGGWR